MSSPPSAKSAAEKNGSLTASSETDTQETEAGMNASESSTELSVEDDGLDANDVIDILSNERRRLLWRYLRQECPEGDLSDASRQIAAWENGTTVEEVDYDERKSVYTSLHQFHCPKMEEAGLIEFDKRESVVRAVSEEPEEFVVEVEPDVNQALIHLRDGRLFPFGWCKFLWYRRQIDALRVIIMGVIKSYQQRGIDAIFYVRTIEEGARKGYRWGEMSWILEDNLPMRQTMESLGGTIYKTYRIYDLEL